MKKANHFLIAGAAVIVTFILSIAAVFIGSHVTRAPQSIANTVLPIESAVNEPCPHGNCRVTPKLYPVGWIPWLADLKSWRNYDPSKIAGIGRLTRSPDGSVTGERLNEKICEKLAAGNYIFAMKYQNNEVAADYINNTDVLYLKMQGDLGNDYIRHSQLAAGFPVFCAGVFSVAPAPGLFGRLMEMNELVEVNNYSGHYKPKCKCLGVLAEKLQSLNVDTQSTVYKFMGVPEDCR